MGVVEMLKESKARYESAFRTSGQAYASLRISAGLNQAGLINEATGGVSHYFKVLELLETAQSDWPSLLGRLEAMRSKMLQRASSATVVNLTGDKKALDAAQGQLGSFCSQLFGEGTSSTEPDWSSLASLVTVKPNEAFSVPTQVNYVAKGGSLYKPGEVTSGADSVVRRFLSLDYLWNQVRVQGGAYGSSASSNPISGSFVFSSYPDQKGMASLRHYLQGTTLEQRKKWRSQVLNASPSDFQRFGDRLAALDATAAVFASSSGIDDANNEGAALAAEKLI